MDEPFTSGGQSKGLAIVIFVLYILSLALFAVLGFTEIGKAENKKSRYPTLFTIPLITKGDIIDNVFSGYLVYVFFFPEKAVYYILFIVLLAVSITAAVLVLLRICSSQTAIIHIAYGTSGLALPFGILFACAGLLIPIIQDTYDDKDYAKNKAKYEKIRFGCGFGFSGLCLLIFMIGYFCSSSCNQSFLAFIFKKCFMSITIVFHMMHFIFALIYFIYWKRYYDWINVDKLSDDMTLASWLSMLIFGVVVMIFSWFGKDFIMSIYGGFVEMAFMIYSSGYKYKYTILGHTYENKYMKKLKTANVTTSAIFMCLLFIFGVLIIFVKKKECLN